MCAGGQICCDYVLFPTELGDSGSGQGRINGLMSGVRRGGAGGGTWSAAFNVKHETGDAIRTAMTWVIGLLRSGYLTRSKVKMRTEKRGGSLLWGVSEFLW
jgi:hypothetical protein